MEALIFDMDGLMVDTETLYFEAEKNLARRFGREVKEETLARMMGRKPLESLVIFAQELNLDVKPEDLLEMRTAIMKRSLLRNLRPMPGLYTIVNIFSGRLKLAIATGAQQEFLDLIVDSLGLRSKFDVLQASDEIKEGKPQPEIYLVTCQKLGLKPQDCLVLEDSANGVLAARRAGCYVIAVPSPQAKGQDFSSAHAIASDLFAAIPIIEKLLLSANTGPL
ncbi:MAG: HAD family phosphatase [Candidatus Aminicenantes bacterium]|nr:HAD family phosphatase [Candidatus Aminicenantes bacterium]